MANATGEFSGRRIIVGVSGSIAAYKAVLLVRILVSAGAEVRVLMTPAAAAFVAPLTFSTLSKHEVLTSVISEEGWNNHVELGLWADAYVIAPATANTLARLAHGICDTVLAAVYLSARCPVLFAPAMDVDMWHHPSTQANIERLTSFGNTIIPVATGELASGLHGAGRLAEPEQIAEAIASSFSKNAHPKQLLNQRVLLTAGPTHEAIDPVRFIANHSSGQMGVALAEALLEQGAQVELVLGPASAKTPHHAQLNITRVRTAQEMYEAAVRLWPNCDAGILAAAVADYRPAEVSPTKIKKTGETLNLELVRNSDIAQALGEQKSARQRLLGFALETTDGEQHAAAKLRRKKLDAIVLNLHSTEQSAFGSSHTAITILGADGSRQSYPRSSKQVAATHIVSHLCGLLA